MKQAIEIAVKLAYAYLKRTEWSEFSSLEHGPSTAVDLIGGFIRRCLPDLRGVPAEVFPRFSAASSTDLVSEANWCLALDRPLKGWWNHLVSRSSFPPWSLALSTYTLEEVKGMYPLSGGDSWNPMRISWCRGAFDVSALALQCQWETDLPALEKELVMQQFPGLGVELRLTSDDWGVYVQDRIARFKRAVLVWIESSLQSGPEHSSFWWSTDAYGRHQVSELDLDERPNIKRLLLRQMSEPDKFSCNRHGELCIFTTALNLMTLLKLEPAHPSIPRLVELCLMGQQNDGSWRAPAIMRIPELHETRPIPEPRRVSEDKGLLTTATVTQALKRYKQQLNRRNKRRCGGPN